MKLQKKLYIYQSSSWKNSFLDFLRLFFGEKNKILEKWQGRGVQSLQIKDSVFSFPFSIIKGGKKNKNSQNLIFKLPNILFLKSKEGKSFVYCIFKIMSLKYK